MALPAPLSRKLRDKLGSDAGEALVTWLEEMRAEHQAQRVEDQAQRAEMAALIQACEARLTERMHSLEIRLTERIGNVQSNLMKWSFVFWCGAVLSVAALAGVLRQ